MSLPHERIYGRSLPVLLIVPFFIGDLTITAIATYQNHLHKHFAPDQEEIANLEALLKRLEPTPVTAGEMGIALTLADLIELDQVLMLFQVFVTLRLPVSPKRGHLVHGLWLLRNYFAFLRRQAE